jgi:hypothetical protein
MKCVTDGQTIKRVSEATAVKLVAEGKWKFTNKDSWKKAPDTSWCQRSGVDNPMSESKIYRQQRRDQAMQKRTY